MRDISPCRCDLWSYGGAKAELLLIGLTVIITILLVNSQTSERVILSKFIITDGSLNGVDISSNLLEVQAYTIFYTDKNDKDDPIFMANIWPNSDTKSFGPMLDTELFLEDESFENYKTETYYFNWQFENSYDNNKGIVQAQFTKIIEPNSVTSTLIITLENSDIFIYNGYIEESSNIILNNNIASTITHTIKDKSIYEVISN